MPDWKVNEWVVVRWFNNKFIGQITEINETDQEFKVNLLRPKQTNKHDGYVYHFPQVPDEINFPPTNLLQKLDAPKKYCRMLLFNVLI